MNRKQIRTNLTALFAAVAFAIIGSAAMAGLFTDAAYAIEQDATNYDLKAVPTEQGLDDMPGVYTVQATMNSDEKKPATIGIPSVAKQNLTPERGATKELPAIIMGAAVNYEVRTGPTEFTPIPGAELLPPYSYFRWGVMEEEMKEPDGSISIHKKLSGFDGSYYIVRVDVSAIIEDAKAKAGGDLTGKYLHVRQQNNKALLVATGMTDNSYVYADTSQTNNKGGCKIAAYPLDNDAAAMKDTAGADKEKPYLDVILMSSAKNVAGADAGSETAPVSDVDLSFYVDDTKDYKPWLHALDPNNMPTFPYRPEGSPVEYKDEAEYNTALTTKFYNEALEKPETSASYFKLMGEDLEIDAAIDNSEETPPPTTEGEQPYRQINWLEEKMDFWSMEHAIAHEDYDNHTIILICEVPVLDAMNISGVGKRSVILDVNSFDIQIANNQEQGEAGLTIGKNAQLRIKDGSNTAGAELAIGNNATMIIEDGGVMVIDETCTAEAEFDAASVVDPSQGTPEYLSGEITVKSGGKMINHGVINIEGTEGKPLDPAQQDPTIRDKKCADILVEYGGEIDNYGCLSLKGILYVMGILNNYGQYNDILTAYDPDKNKIEYHRGIQVTWKDDVTQEGVEPGVLNVGIDADGNVNMKKRAVLNNYGDIVIVPGTLNLYGIFNNKTETNGYAGHLYLCTVTEAIIPFIDPNDPLVVEKRIQLDTPRKGEFNNNGTLNNEGVIDGAKVELIHNGVLGELIPAVDISNYAATLEKTSYEYTGKEIRPAVTVSGLTAGDYTVTYSDNTAIGTAKVTIEGNADKNFKGIIEKTFTITKKTNNMSAKNGKKTYKAKALKKKAKSFRIASVIKVSGEKGKVSYKAKAVNAKSKKVLTFKNGKVTVKKKTKKGTYKMKVTVRDAGTDIYKPATRNVTLTVIVK